MRIRRVTTNRASTARKRFSSTKPNRFLTSAALKEASAFRGERNALNRCKAFGKRSLRTAKPLALATILMLLCGGCGYSQGAFLYMLGFGQRKMVKAEFRLTSGPILILVDDPSGQVNWPAARAYLMDDLSQALIKEGAADRIIPRETLNVIRRDHADYAKLSCREIGELAGAEQVLWLAVQQYRGHEEFFEPNNAAYFVISVKVINALEKKNRARVKLWPGAPRGHLVNVSLDGSAVARAGTKDAIARQLARKLADEVAKLFYDYRPGDFERER